MKVKVCLYGDAELLYKCYKPEVMKKERVSYTIKKKKKKKKLEFNINARDDVALKAAINSIFKLFVVYNKLRKVNKNGRNK